MICKKRIIIMLSVLMLSFFVIGCESNEKEYYDNELKDDYVDEHACSKNNFLDCFHKEDCEDVGGQWCESQYVCAKPGECPVCSIDNVQLCLEKEECEEVGAYWCDDGYCSKGEDSCLVTYRG